MGKIQPQPSTGPGTARAVAWPSTAITQWQREVIAAAGGDPSIVPEAPFKFLRLTTLFAGMNLALLVGFWRWVNEEPQGAWSRTARH